MLNTWWLLVVVVVRPILMAPLVEVVLVVFGLRLLLLLPQVLR
jgi:hypothetical protein